MTSENQNRDPRKGPWLLVLFIAVVAFAIAIGIVAWTSHLGMFGAKGA